MNTKLLIKSLSIIGFIGLILSVIVFIGLLSVSMVTAAISCFGMVAMSMLLLALVDIVDSLNATANKTEKLVK